VTASAERFLLHPSSDLINDLGAEPDHMEGVEHRDRVRELVVDGVGVAAERVQGGVLDVVDELLGLGLQPGFVDTPGAAHDGVEQPGMQASGLVTGQIDDDGDGSIDPDPRWPPDVFVHSEGLHALQPVRVGGAGLGFELDRVPAGMPVHT
jgi:hypothetical protein